MVNRKDRCDWGFNIESTMKRSGKERREEGREERRKPG